MSSSGISRASFGQTLSPKAVDWLTLRGEWEFDLLVVTAGFEERARTLLRQSGDLSIPAAIMLNYGPGIPENEECQRWMKGRLEERAGTRVAQVLLEAAKPGQFEARLRDAATSLGIGEAARVWLDLSGLTMLGTCLTLHVLRTLLPGVTLRLFYTEAREYYPKRQEYERYARDSSAERLDTMPPALSTEMADNLIPEQFAGFALKEAPTCLLLYAGYEAHRAIGAVDYLNPSRLVLIWGCSPRTELDWRKEMSQRLHRRLVRDRLTAEEEASTLDVGANVDLLLNYYDMLYDDHNIAISPICSKMQAVAAYLASEIYRDIQLVFPMPIHYLPRRFSEGSGTTFILDLPPPLRLTELASRGSEESPRPDEPGEVRG